MVQGALKTDLNTRLKIDKSRRLDVIYLIYLIDVKHNLTLIGFKGNLNNLDLNAHVDFLVREHLLTLFVHKKIYFISSRAFQKIKDHFLELAKCFNKGQFAILNIITI